MAKRKSSYQAYLDNIEAWRNKGYAMDIPMSKEKYYETYNDLKKSGIKNIARELAKHERSFSMTDARTISRNIQKELDSLEEFDSKKHDKDEYDAYKSKLTNLREKYKNARDIIASPNRRDTFMDLLNVFGREKAEAFY